MQHTHIDYDYYQLTFIFMLSENVALTVLVIRCSGALKAKKTSQIQEPKSGN